MLARLVLRLFAARPDNPAIAVLLRITEPLIVPLAFLDAGQPRFGAVLECSSLALFLILCAAVILTHMICNRRTNRGVSSVSIRSAREVRRHGNT